MKTLVSRALNQASALGANYADVRIVHHRSQQIDVKNGIVEGGIETESQGLGVRVLLDGAWGFASSPTLKPAEADKAAAQAIAVARASSMVPGASVQLGPPVCTTGLYRTPVAIDPSQVSLSQKVELLLEADSGMRRAGATFGKGTLVYWKQDKVFGSTEGSLLEQSFTETGGGIEAIAVDHSSGEVQKRSYPNSFGRDQRAAGWEAILEMDLAGNAERVGSEAVALLSAPPCPTGISTVILGPTQLALQVHESCGHPIELDRVFGTEISWAGSSFLTPNLLGHFRYGSDRVNITADATAPGGLGTFGWDDEGVPAQRVPIVRDGIFVGYLTSRETAQQLRSLLGNTPLRSGGAMRATNWNRIPLIRMTNVNLDPGQWNFEDLIADTDDGIYLDTNKSWSIDDRRLNFQFGTEIAFEIKGGKLGRMLKNATYTGITPEFWASCDAVCNRDHWRVWGTANCGKGQPTQLAHVGHGTAPARFRNVQVGLVS